MLPFFMHNDLLYQIALTMVPNVGAVQAKILVEEFGDANSIFKAKQKHLETIEGIGEVRATSIKSFDDFTAAEHEIEFLHKHHIQPLFLQDVDYPKRLLNCYDSPTLLYYRGNADLNTSRVVSIIGTRNNTEYGKQLTEQLVEKLQPYNVLVVSGLAYGIDALSHKAAVACNLPTVGVLAHGLDKIYPPQHKPLAKQMLLNGGLLTEFRKDTLPDKHNFPRRNRIVAGMADAVVVVETASRGGSMITAELANGYNKDVFAFPGRTTDSKSAGCNELIRQNKAILLNDADEMIELLGWKEKKVKPRRQAQLFVDLSEDEQKLLDILQHKEQMHIDEVYIASGLNSSSVAAAMLNLEFQNMVISLPGKMYRLA
ncbi:DNA-processing protein DprA [Aridibaculum aurantiacum]|uniref:DNA-processing protein DprA n=1 Tax=Aridibaculum aurantiacum TaxID=2810307 RepID=UPI001F61E472|nr:DNA-processing protein DprA [Aridibaculum aurantiacum]